MKIVVSLMAVLAIQVTSSRGHAPRGRLLGQPAFHVCAKPTSGVTYLVHDGLDADQGTARNQHGMVQLLVGRPSAFFDSPVVFVAPRSASTRAHGRGIAVTESIPREMTLVGAIGPTEEDGAAALYGYMPEGAKQRGTQDPVLVLLQAGKGAASLELMAAVGGALYRCD
jgi:hypothetical protein